MSSTSNAAEVEGGGGGGGRGGEGGGRGGEGRGGKRDEGERGVRGVGKEGGREWGKRGEGRGERGGKRVRKRGEGKRGGKGDRRGREEGRRVSLLCTQTMLQQYTYTLCTHTTGLHNCAHVNGCMVSHSWRHSPTINTPQSLLDSGSRCKHFPRGIHRIWDVNMHTHHTACMRHDDISNMSNIGKKASHCTDTLIGARVTPITNNAYVVLDT